VPGQPPLLDQLADPVTLHLPAPPEPAGDLPTAAGAVLLLTRSADDEFTALARSLTAAGIPVLRLDADRLPTTRLGELGTPTVSWIRRFSRAAVPGGADPAGSFAADAWTVLAAHLAGRAAHPLPGPPIGPLDQLTGAAALGVRVPRWTVTGSPGTAGLGGRVVVKTLGPHFTEPVPGTLYGAFPQVWAAAELAARPDPGFPVLVEEYVAHQAEYRVYAVGPELIAYRVGKPDPASLWRGGPVEITRADPPGPVATAARRLADAWRLGYAAFDFLVADGEPVFLEANLDGDWRWFEREAGDRAVTRATTALVHTHHTTAAGPRHPTPLLTFLTA
jgi:hypothetical protein